MKIMKECVVVRYNNKEENSKIIIELDRILSVSINVH